MDISAVDKELLKCFVQLDELQKNSLLQLIKSFLKTDALHTRPTIEQYNRDIEAAMERVQKGQFTTLEELEREMESW